MREVALAPSRPVQHRVPQVTPGPATRRSPGCEQAHSRRASMLIQAHAGRLSGLGTSDVPRRVPRITWLPTVSQGIPSSQETFMASRRGLKEQVAFASHAVHHRAAAQP